jgi:hypothetical protein
LPSAAIAPDPDGLKTGYLIEIAALKKSDRPTN